MNKFLKKAFLLLPLVAITSCGYSLEYIVEGDTYNSSVFSKNYYKVWHQELKNAKKGISKDVTPLVGFDNLKTIDPNVLERYSDIEAYGQDYKMNKVDDSFNYGVPSKLFDGNVYCDGRHQTILRMQAASSGFSVRFSKEGNFIDEHSNYVALQFKATTNNQLPCLKVNEVKEPDGSNVVVQQDALLFHDSSIVLTLTLYTKNESNEIISNEYHALVVFDHHKTNDGSKYTFIAIDLNNENLNRIVGASITFTFDDELINWNASQGVTNLEYALFIYELFIPYTSWN